MKKIIIPILAMIQSFISFGYVCEDDDQDRVGIFGIAADVYYRNRLGDRLSAYQAMVLYEREAAFSSSAGDRLRYGVLSMRSQDYTMLLTKAEERSEGYRDCYQRWVELINPSRIGFESFHYYYFKALCLVNYRESKSMSAPEDFKTRIDLKETIDKAEEFQGAYNYDGAGISYIKARYYSDPRLKNTFEYSPEGALSDAYDALDSGAYPGQSPGYDYCRNHQAKIKVLLELDRGGEAYDAAKEAMHYFNFLDYFGELGEREPEEKDCLQKMYYIVRDGFE